MDDQEQHHSLRPGAVASTVLAALLLVSCGKTSPGITLSTPAPEASAPVGAAPVVTNPPASGATSASPSPSPTPSHTAPSPTSAAPQTEEQKVLAAYSAYYNALESISAMPAGGRPAALAKLTVDPLYSAVLKELAERDSAGKVGYGRIVVKPKVALLQGTSAAIEDCQDTSASGLMNRATGEKLTVGVKATKRLSEMKRGTDGAWRISTVGRTAEATC